MTRIDESRWVDLSTRGDRDSGRSRFVKTLGVEDGFGRAVRIEVVGDGNAKAPREEVLTYALYEWLRTR